ncbi:MAG: recombination mediator RecR [Anaerolineae bacterium]
MELAKPVARLIEEFAKLPGIGPKTASRLTYYLLRAPAGQVLALSDAIRQLRERIVYCQVCYNISEEPVCPICANPQRDHSQLCVVEEPLDVMAIERTGEYHGVYHVLHGVLAPMEGIGPEQLKISELAQRVRQGGVREIILATNPNLEGEATAMYIARLLAPLGVKVTRLAHGLPVGGDLEYADEVTLRQAILRRAEM